MIDTEGCTTEVHDLHEFFAAWYRGEPVSFDRVEQALAPDFEMIAPDGRRLDRAAVLSSVREGRDARGDEGFEIEIRAVEPVAVAGEHAVLRYEEWQTADADTDGRISTAVFRSASRTPNGVEWVTVHETRLDPPREGERE